MTGGAGYIGSHTHWQLIEAGFDVVVLDNFYSGQRWAVHPDAKLVEAGAGDVDAVRGVIREHGVKAVIHFAGHIVVPESVSDPLKYYANNTCTSRNLIEACVAEGVKNFVFSSSAAVYGIPRSATVHEDSITNPISPYGSSKLMTEWMLRDVAGSYATKRGGAPEADLPFTYVALRYFNVAGARPDRKLGQATPEATHLIKTACEAACGLRESVSIYGTDYDTSDGTCIRDYIHVDDLAAAHLAALEYLAKGGASEVLNCGYGRGYSVREVIDMVKRVSETDFPVREEDRRAGDVPVLVSDPARLKHLLDWQPRYADLETICATAYRWEKRYQDRSAGNRHA